MDEATANVDRATDAHVQRAVAECGGATRLVVAHRLDTVMDLDSVAVVDAGVLAEQGVPCELLAKGEAASPFARMVGAAASQMMRQSPSSAELARRLVKS